MIARRSLPIVRGQLLRWFRQNKRDLPWRHTRDPYRIWLSEIMLQQTRVAAVIRYYEKFCASFPNAEALANAPEQEVLRLWSGLGYYSRARNLQSAAREIVSRHGGKFPAGENEIRALRGIGSYTTNAILSIAFGKKYAVLDGNVARVLARVYGMRGDLRETARWRTLQENADYLLDSDAPGDWNQAMMELGATICTPRSPQCGICPMERYCEARKLGIQEIIPEKRNKRASVAITLAVAVITDKEGRCLMLAPPGRSKEKIGDADIPTLVSNLWHFPAIAVSRDAVMELRRHARKLLPGVRLPAKFISLGKIKHAVTYRALNVLAFAIKIEKLPAVAGARKVPLQDFASLPISNLTRKVARLALPGSREYAK